MSKNKKLHTARREKNDEFYTQLVDVEKELVSYTQSLRGKRVLCPCDSEKSNIYRYLKEQFEALELAELKASCYVKDGQGELLTYDGKTELKTYLEGNGDFQSEEVQELFKACEVVITNPPFSLLRAFVDCLEGHGVGFLFVGPLSAATYKNVFKMIHAGKMCMGITRLKNFEKHDGSMVNLGNCVWYTNLKHINCRARMELSKTYNPVDYPKYDNYDAIEVSRVKDIPADYDGVMGVPITFLEKYCPEQFEICGTQRWFYDESLGSTGGKTMVSGKETYDRIFIKRKKPEFEILGITDRENSSGLKTKTYSQDETPRANDFNGTVVVRQGSVYIPRYARLLIKKKLA